LLAQLAFIFISKLFKRIKLNLIISNCVLYAMRYIFFHMMMLCSICASAQERNVEPKLIKSIYFGGGSYWIDDFQIQELQEFINEIEGIQNYTITIHSYTDNIGSPEYNQQLSEFRSQSAIDELLKLAIALERMSIKDFGQFNPIYDNSTLEGRMRNRRVDIILWPDFTL